MGDIPKWLLTIPTGKLEEVYESLKQNYLVTRDPLTLERLIAIAGWQEVLNWIVSCDFSDDVLK